MTLLATQCGEVMAKQGVREEGAEEKSRGCSSLPFPPSTSKPLALTNTATFLLICYTGSFYINKQRALVGTSTGLTVPHSQGKEYRSESHSQRWAGPHRGLEGPRPQHRPTGK